MNVNFAPPHLGQIIGAPGISRVRIAAELAELGDLLEHPDNPPNDPRIQGIAAWRTSFLLALRHPDPQAVINAFVPELVRFLRNPQDVEQEFPAELFGDRPIPIIQVIVQKLRNRNSLFYSELFDQEAVRVLAAIPAVVQNVEANIPAALLEQLRQIEANSAQQVQQEVQGMEGIQALRGRLQQREVNLQANIDRVARENMEAGQRIQDEAERLRLIDLDQRAIMLEAAERQRQEAENLRAENVRLQQNLVHAGSQLGELERATVQLQVEINRAKAEMADSKSNWLKDVVCIVASVVISYYLQRPVIITA